MIWSRFPPVKCGEEMTIAICIVLSNINNKCMFRPVDITTAKPTSTCDVSSNVSEQQYLWERGDK